MQSPLYLVLAAALILPLATLAASPAAHDHGAATPQKVERNAGKKWHIDAPLRQGMNAMHKAVNRTLPLAHAGKARAADYDAQLHVVIGEILGGVDAAQGKEGEQARAAGVVKVAQALNTYGSHFNHSGWKAIALPH